MSTTDTPALTVAALRSAACLDPDVAPLLADAALLIGRLSGELETARADVVKLEGRVTTWKTRLVEETAQLRKALETARAEAAHLLRERGEALLWSPWNDHDVLFEQWAQRRAVVSGTSQAAADDREWFTAPCVAAELGVEHPAHVLSERAGVNCGGAVAGTGEQAAPIADDDTRCHLMARERGDLVHSRKCWCQDEAAAPAPTPAEDVPAGGAA